MFTRVWPRLVTVAMSVGFLGIGAFPVTAQSATDAEPHQHPAADEPGAQDGGHQHDAQHLSHEHGGEAAAEAARVRGRRGSPTKRRCMPSTASARAGR